MISKGRISPYPNELRAFPAWRMSTGRGSPVRQLAKSCETRRLTRLGPDMAGTSYDPGQVLENMLRAEDRIPTETLRGSTSELVASIPLIHAVDGTKRRHAPS